MPQKACVRIIDEGGATCGFPVGGGGDRHALHHCPPARLPGENRRARKSAGRRVEQRREKAAAAQQAIAEARSAAKAKTRDVAER